MTFQASDYKEKNFLDLNNNDNLPTRLTYSKDGAWPKHIRYSNTSYMHTTREITNHASISKYHLRFFLKESFACLCRNYPIKLRNHILNNCK